MINIPFIISLHIFEKYSPLLSIALVLLSFSCTEENKSIQLKHLLFQYSKTNNYNDALVVVDQLIALKPEDSELFLIKGFINTKLKLFNSSCKDFERAYDLGDSIKAKYLMRIYCEHEKKDFPVKDIEELIVFLKGIEKARNGKLKEARLDFDETLRLNSLNYEAYYFRGAEKFYIQKDDEGALKDLDSSIKINPNYPNAFYLRGIIYMKSGQNDSAINYYSKAISMKPELADAYYYRGVLFVRNGQKEKGYRDLLKADSLGFPFASEALKSLRKR